MSNGQFSSKAKRILVFRIGELGDTLIALPALRAIRRSFPDAFIALLGNADRRGKHVNPRQLLPSTGLIDDWLFFPSDEGRGSRVSDRIRLFKQVRQGRYDTLVYLGPRIRRPLDVHRDLLFFRLAGISNVIGQKGLSMPRGRVGGFLPAIEHEADHLLQRLAPHGISVPPNGGAEFALELTAAEQLAADDWLSETVPQDNDNVIGFGPGSKWPSKIWPEERFASLGQRLMAEKDVFPIVFGGREERELGQRLVDKWGRGGNAAGRLSVRQTAAALKRCRLYVGNDTGTMHLAAAVGTSCVVVMPALDWPGHWYPYGAGHAVLRRRVPCEGCLLRECKKEGMRCLKEISVADVYEACLAKISEPHSPG